MFLTYGTTQLNVIDILRYERDAVYSEDGQDLLYVMHTLGISATYAPGGTPNLVSVTRVSADTDAMFSGADRTAAVLRGDPRGADPGTTAAILDPAVMEGSPAGIVGLPPVADVVPISGVTSQRTGPETDGELYRRLMTPRQRLILYAWGRDGRLIRWLESPRPGSFVTDAVGGPRPIACDIVGAAGEPHSIAVYFEIQTAIPPCPTGSDRFVLSHRWEMSHGHDDDFYLTRTIEGTVVFNRGVAELVNIHPDRIRNQFVHPIPLGFKRGLPEITQSSDGNTIHYVITDTEPTIVFAPGHSGATQIDIEEKFEYVLPGGAGLPRVGSPGSMIGQDQRRRGP